MLLPLSGVCRPIEVDASSSLGALYAKLHDMEGEVARAHELRLRRSVVKQLLVVGGAASRKLRREDALRKVMRDLERVLGFDIATYVTRHKLGIRHTSHFTRHTSLTEVTTVLLLWYYIYSRIDGIYSHGIFACFCY